MLSAAGGRGGRCGGRGVGRPHRLGAGATPWGRGVPRRKGPLSLGCGKETSLVLPRCSEVLGPLPGAPRRAERLCVRASLARPVRALGAMDSSALERDAVQFARLAVQRDHEGRYSEAVFYYKVSRGPRLPWRRPGGGVQVPRRPGPLAFAFILFLLSFSGERRPAVEARRPTPTRASGTGGRAGRSFGAPASLVAALTGSAHR